jgi:hypothetical protein
MTRLGSGLGILALALVGAPAAQAYQPGAATTKIVSIGKTNSGTGNTAAPPINATVITVDTGSSINSTGFGTGFQTQGLYVSVLYENGSMATGPKACLPAGKVNFGDRIIGAWVPDGSTTRVLAPVTEVGQAYTGTKGAGSGGQLVGNWDKGTISVRMVNLIKPPVLYANLQACGRVHTTSDVSSAESNIWSTSLSDLLTFPSTSPASLTGLAQQAANSLLNPTVPPLPVGVAPTTVAAPAAPSASGRTVTVPGPTKTVTTPAVTLPGKTVTVPGVTLPGKTVTVPGVTKTVTVPGVTKTVTTPAVTVTVPSVVTVTVPKVALRTP